MNSLLFRFFLEVRLPYKPDEMRKFITLTVLTIVCLTGRSQSIERKLVGTSGSTLTGSGYQLSFSMGEVMITPSPAATLNYVLLTTIGFQQPHVAKTGSIVAAKNWVSAYPNPAVNNVRLDIHGDNFETNYIWVTNAAGQIVIAPFSFVNGSIDINVSRLAGGVYIVAVTDKTSGSTVSTKIIKQN